MGKALKPIVKIDESYVTHDPVEIERILETCRKVIQGSYQRRD